MDGKQQDCLIKHPDANNNHQILVKDFCPDSSSLMNAIHKLNETMPFFAPNNDSLHNATNSVIQQSKNAKTFALQNIYNNAVPNNDFIEQVKSCENANTQQLVQILKPFYNSMLEKPSPLISSENSGALYVIDSERKFNLVDPQNPVLNSEFLKQKKSSDFMYHHPNVNYPNLDVSHPHPPPHPTSTMPVQQNYFNGYAGNLCNNNDPRSINPSSTAENVNHFSSNKMNHSTKNLEHNPVAQTKINNSSASNTTGNHHHTTTTTTTTTTHTRGRKKSKRGPFICVECRKEFCNQSTLTKHMITHSDERKFVCLQCSKAFKRHDHLNGHMLTHREHKPYACDIEGCDKSYCDSRSLRRHKEKHKENALQNNDVTSLSHNTISLLTTTEKAEAHVYQPVNASAHLQFLASQQKKPPQTSLNHADDHEEDVTSKLSATELNDGGVNKSIGPISAANHHQHHHHNHNLHNENALLHQLLTSNQQDKPAPLFTNNTTNHARQSIIQNNNSTVIKINDNYGNVCSDPATGTYLQTMNATKTLGSKEELDTANPNSNKKDISLLNDEKQPDSFECSICLKKFPTLTTRNAHLRIHSDELKSEQFLFHHKSNIINEATPVATNLNSTYEFQNMKNYELANPNKNFGYVEPQKTAPTTDSFADMNMFEKSGIEFRNVYDLVTTAQHQHHQYGSSEAIMSDENGAKHNLIDSNHLYAEQIYENDKNDSNIDSHESNYEVSNDLSQTKGLNEVMFSPITPVTPLKNNSQFTFDFTDPNVERQTRDKIDCNNQQIDDYVTTLDNHTIQENFCYEPSKPDNNDSDLLGQKDGLELEQQAQQQQQQPNFDHHQSLNHTQINDFVDHGSLSKNFDADLSSNQFFDANKEPAAASAFNSFDFPSNKFTSDLFNRRARKNIDVNKTKELLSIKQIAASLQSFSQNYERNQQQNQQNHLNHSYSVPTTPCVQSAPVSANLDSQYHMNNLSHHSLPNTPVDGHHFTFKTGNNMYHQEVASLPSTPIENQHQQHAQSADHQQFNFIFPTDNVQPQQQQQQTPPQPPSSHEDLSRNFDINHCLGEANYPEFMYDSSKEISNEFIDNINHYGNGNVQHNDPQLPVNDMNNNVNFFETSTSIEFVPGTPRQSDDDCNSIMDTYIAPLKDFIDDHIPQVDQHHASPNEQNRPEPEQELPMKDINENYIIVDNDPSADILVKPKHLSQENGVYPRIKSPNFIKSLTKKLSSINNAAQQLNSQKKKPRPSPLYIPPHVNTFVYHSRLRSPRLWNGPKLETKHVSPPPYTPPPMLSPVRSGSGLFWKINSNNNNNSNSSGKCHAPTANGQLFNTIKNKMDKKESNEPDLKTPTTAYEPYEPCEYDIPQTDIQPHVNVGPSFQARIPEFNPNRAKMKCQPDRSELFWNPAILDKINDEQLDLYFKISCSMCIAGHGNNREYALHLLYFCEGNILEALGKLVDADTRLSVDHPLSGYYYAEHDVWNRQEIESFRKSILKYDKDFSLISKEIKTKSVKECIQFYYLWKKNSIDSVKRLRILRRKRDCSVYYDFDENAKKAMNELQNDCDENFDENLANNNTNDGKAKTAPSKTALYQCGRCEKTFKNLKSRNAHHKTHENE